MEHEEVVDEERKRFTKLKREARKAKRK